ncbi:MAG: GAF domain-containing protein [Anaerolineales bacterium]|jgi:PAS domain S-box-containing protein
MDESNQLQRHIKKRQRAVTQIRAENSFSDSVLDAIDVLIVILDRNGRIVRFNRACEKLTGYSFNEIKDRSFWELLFAPEERIRIQDSFDNLIASHSSDKGDNEWVTKDGRRLLISWSINALPGTNGAADYFIFTGNDITEHEHTALLQNASESLQRVTTALLQHLTTLEDVLTIVCTDAIELTGATGSAVLLLEDEMWFRVKSSSGVPIPVLERLPVGDSFAGLVIEQGKPLLLNDPESEMQAYYRNHNLRTLLAVPLIVDDTIIGALDVVNKPGGFTNGDIQLIQLFADQVAIAIEHALLHQQAEKLAVIEERQRLARELHDSVTQALYSVTLYADATRMAISAGKNEVANEHLRELQKMAREAMMDMRLLIFELHPPVLEEEGLVTAVQTRLETVEARSGLRTSLHVEGEENRLPLSIEEELYRVVQEALSNAVKHAKAETISIDFLYEDDHFCLEVRDDGRGFNRADARQSGGLGLRGIEERVERIGGNLIIESAAEMGTALKIEIDL